MMRSFLALTLAGLTLAACAGAPTRFHTLSAQPAALPAAAKYVGPPFRVDVVHIPATLDRPELVRDAGGGRFTVSDNDHWAAPVGELLRQVLTQDLAAQFPGQTVVYPDSPKPPGASGLVIDILAVSTTADGVEMQASWTLVPAHVASNDPAPEVRRGVVRLTTGASADDAALSDLVAQLAASIAASLH
jgi:uncharacterized lipoprotein YmbA